MSPSCSLLQFSDLLDHVAGEHGGVISPGALGVVRLPASSLEAFLRVAVRFANERLAGTLAAHLLVDPATARTHSRLLDRAVADLRFGTVAVNEWAIVSFYLGYTAWGAYPGYTPELIGSGTGRVLNPFHFPDPEKTVIWGAFRPLITPVTSVKNRTATTTAQRLLTYLSDDNPRHLPGILTSAIRG
jgi:hypothetical protein